MCSKRFIYTFISINNGRFVNGIIKLCFLITKSVEASEKPTIQTASKGNYYGIEGIARIFGCSVPTANRIKKSGIIDKAITQIGRKIVVDADLALSLAKESGGIRIKEQ